MLTDLYPLGKVVIRVWTRLVNKQLDALDYLDRWVRIAEWDGWPE